MAQNSANGHSRRQVAAGIGNFAAATVLWVAAVMTVFQGISALTHDEVVLVWPDYLYEFNTTAWGWIHIVVGVLLAAVALGLFWTATWARIAAIVIAALSILSMFMWLPHSPIWSVVVIAFDLLAIWAVANWTLPPDRPSRNQADGAAGSAAEQPPP
ncbi:DUF7144 family membrane protein [Mycobacterium sp.]|uniref:DUF7144 family membrane protein n=1 Tax=Mycobacterium sp. TaxID=1785 RepID=UPI002CF98C1B|nr:hypothetical protein [Mycobacterium sp.]HTY34605.1 hypothetical protein [Mycobacterium sp.]